MVDFRIATPADIEQIATLHTASWQDNYRGILSDAFLDHDIHLDRKRLWQQRLSLPEANQHILVACEGNTVSGFICLYLDNHPEWGTLIENLHVSNCCQGQGLGKQLLVAAAELAYAQSHSKGMYLEVLADNRAAQRFYLQLGAINIKTKNWQAPDGNLISEFVFQWKSLSSLALNKTPLYL